mmetsp:Transcript_49089/g.122736  ORF Transcript_49089/g.122736 Transcript_49089/m.122736 type:complete len:210 (-) Transcript_49089:122-751(-)
MPMCRFIEGMLLYMPLRARLGSRWRSSKHSCTVLTPLYFTCMSCRSSAASLQCSLSITTDWVVSLRFCSYLRFENTHIWLSTLALGSLIWYSRVKGIPLSDAVLSSCPVCPRNLISLPHTAWWAARAASHTFSWFLLVKYSALCPLPACAYLSLLTNHPSALSSSWYTLEGMLHCVAFRKMSTAICWSASFSPWPSSFFRYTTHTSSSM